MKYQNEIVEQLKELEEEAAQKRRRRFGSGNGGARKLTFFT